MLIDVGGVCYAVCAPVPCPVAGEERPRFCMSKRCCARPVAPVGFKTRLEREWLLRLQTVQGIGAKVALAILSTLSPSELANAIALRDTAMISARPASERRWRSDVTELKNKVPAPGLAGAALELKRDL